MNGRMGSAMVKSAEGTQLKSIIISFDLINLIQETKHETQINSFCRCRHPTPKNIKGSEIDLFISYVSSQKQAEERNPRSKATMKYIFNPELISFHIMAFHTQAGKTKNNSGETKKNCKHQLRSRKEEVEVVK